MRAARRPDLPCRSVLPASLRVSGALGAAVVLVAALASAGPAVATTPACGPFTGGVHEVATAAQLGAIGSGGAGSDCDPARTYRLVSDITVPTRSTAVVIPTFTGMLDGAGHTITLDIDHTDPNQGESLGLFLMLDGATISDLTLAGSVATVGTGRAGALAAFVVGTGATTIEGVSSTVDVAARNDVGGLIGLTYATGLLSLSSVQVGASDDPIELNAVRHSGGLIGTTVGPVTVGAAAVHARTTLRDPGGSDSNYHGGLTSYVADTSSFTVDGSATGDPYGVTVSYALDVPEVSVFYVGGIAGRIVGTSDVLVRGASVDVAIATAAYVLGGIAGDISPTSTTTIGGSRPEDGVRITGSITTNGPVEGRAGGIATWHHFTSNGTTVRGLTMAASITGERVGGLYSAISSSASGPLEVIDTVVSGALEGSVSAGGIASSIDAATLTLEDVLVSSDIRAELVGGISSSARSATMTLDDVQVTGTLRSRAAVTNGLRSVGGLFHELADVTFAATPTFSAADATIEASFPEGLAVGSAFLRAAGLVATVESGVDLAVLTGAPATLVITVSEAMRDAGRCRVATRFVRFGETGQRIDPLSPDPCSAAQSTITGDSTDDDSTDDSETGGGDVTRVGSTDGGQSIGLVCTWPRLAVGAQVTCEATGGPVDTELVWNARVNPVVAGGVVVLDGAGAGTFTFVVPRTAIGEPLTVELVEWRDPLLLGTVAGVVPTSVPAGRGGPAWAGGSGVRGGLLVLLGGALGWMVLRRRRTAGVPPFSR